MKLKRLLSSVAAFALIMSIAGGCGSSGGNGPADSTAAGSAASAGADGASGVLEAGQFPITKEKVTITCYADVDPKSDVENNAFLKYLEEKTNVTLKVTKRPSNQSDTSTIKNLLLASNDYPEMFLMNATSAFSMSEMLKYGQQDKIFIPLNNLIDKYGYELKKLYDEFPQLKQIMVATDGNIYGLNQGSQCQHCGSYPKMWVNMDWLEKLNMPVPTTTDEFEKMLMAFKTKDPGNVGSENVIPLTADLDETIDYWLVNSFIPYSAHTAKWLTGSNECYVDDNGKVIFSADKPEFKDALNYMHRLYSQGLIDKAAFSQTMEQARATTQKKSMRVGAFVAMHLGCTIDLNDKETYGAYHAIPPLKGPDGVQYQPNIFGVSSVNQNTSAQGVITDKCKNPEAAFRVLDYFMNPEVSMLKSRGQEGVDWNKAQPGTASMLGPDIQYTLVNHETNSEPANTLMNRTFYCGLFLDTIKFRNLYTPAQTDDVLNSDPAYYESRLQKETIPLEKYYYPHDLPNMIFMSDEDAASFNEMATNINTYVGKSVAEFVIGSKSLDSDWDNYLKDLQKFKLDEFLKLYQKAYDSYSKSAK